MKVAIKREQCDACISTAEREQTRAKLKTLALSELRRVAERFDAHHDRVPWRVWYIAASNGDMILGEEVVTLSVELGGPGRFPSRLVQFTASGQTRRLRDCCILRADNFHLIV